MFMICIVLTLSKNPKNFSCEPNWPVGISHNQLNPVELSSKPVGAVMEA